MQLWRFKSGSDTIIKLCCALLRSVPHWKMSRSPISCRFWSRAYIKMQKIHKIIASLTPEYDGRTTRSRSSRWTGLSATWPLPVPLWLFFTAPLPLLGPIFVFSVFCQVYDTSSSFGNNAMSGLQVAALFIGMLTERGYCKRAWGSLPSVTKPLNSWESMRVLYQSVTKRNKACQSLMKASALVSDLHARS